MKTTRNGSLAAREPVFKTTRNTSEITTDNTVKQQGTVIGEVIMLRTRDG